jgi:hypothetical protein
VVVGFRFSLIPKIGPIPTRATPLVHMHSTRRVLAQSLVLKATPRQHDP